MRRSCMVALALLGALAGCGGGGGGGGGSMPQAQNSNGAMPMPQPQNLKSALAPQEPFNIPALTLYTNVDGNSYTAIYSQTPNSGTTMFDGQAASSSTISLTVSENGSDDRHGDQHRLLPRKPV